MDRFADLARQLTELVRMHVPAEAIPPALPSAVVLLVFGVSICVLGARLARWFITVLLAVGGLIAGLRISQWCGVSAPLGALVAAVSLGAVGYLLYRLWVGLFTGAFLASVACSLLSVQLVVPHLIEFDKAERAVAVEEFHPGTGRDTAAAGWDHLDGYLRRFGDYLIDHEPRFKRYAALGVVGAGLLGVLMGVLLCRMTLILFSAAMGTSLIGSGVAMLGPNIGLDVYETCQQRPEMTAVALASFFLVSIVLQVVLTRSAAARPVVSKQCVQ